MTYRTKRIALVAIGLLVILTSLAIAPHPVRSNGTPIATAEMPTPFVVPSPVAPAPPGCTRVKTPYYRFYNEKKESPGSFGSPAASYDIAAVVGDLKLRLCGNDELGGDKRLFLALEAVISNTNPTREVTNDQWASAVSTLVLEDIDWESARMTEEETTPNTRTLYMSDRNNDGTPEVAATKLRQRTSQFLILQVYDRYANRWVELKLRLQCGFQPVFKRAATPTALL